MRKPYSNGVVPADLGIRGTHRITLKVGELEPSQEFMTTAWSGREVARDGKYVRYALGNGGPGAFVDFALELQLPQASWTYSEASCVWFLTDVINAVNSRSSSNNRMLTPNHTL
jgi:glyoxalase family protein